jgi:hypothetical protein
MHWLPDLSGTPWRAIPLSYRQEVWCLVDAADYGWLVDNAWNVWWSGRARWQLYAKRNTGTARDTVRMHREILIRADPRPAGELVVLQGDHRNGQTLDNRRANLRWLLPAENRANLHPREQIPSLELIVMRLLNTPAARQLEAMPF